ncbi:hypothetical protein QQ045_014784 [Rhodiola kirilowii]
MMKTSGARFPDVHLVCQEEEEWEVIEKRLGCGQIDELIEVARDGLTPFGEMIVLCKDTVKLMPESMASLNCSELRAADHDIEDEFQCPVSVDDFMQRMHTTDQPLIARVLV